MTCEYCSGSFGDGEVKCGNCGAPSADGGSALHDFRICPSCHRRLLALGSPACNYCGRRLPDDYLKARDADLKRITDVKEGDGTTELGRKVDELIGQTVLNGLGGLRRSGW